MPRSQSATGQGQLFTLLLVIAVVAVLYLAKEVLIPFALAVLISFLVAPLVSRLERWGLWRVPSVLLVVGLALLLVSGLGYAIGGQIIELAGKAEGYRERIEEKYQQLVPSAADRDPQKGHGRTSLGKIQHAIEQLRLIGQGSKPAQTTAPVADKPVPVEIAISSVAIVQSLLTPVMSVLVTAGVVTVFTIFMLVGREDLRNRILRLAGPARINLTTQVLDDAANRVSRYLVMQFIVNSTYGIILAIGLSIIGIPNAILWGMLAAILRYIPYVGPWIAAAFPTAISIGAFPSWTPMFLTIGFLVALELISNNLMEPILYGSSTGVSTIGILVAAVFWTWLWGGVGLVLATPLTVCIVVLGSHIPRLEFFNVLLGDEPVLDPGALYYQRLLAGDPEEADRIMEAELKDHTTVEIYDTLLLPALTLAEQDRHRGLLDETKQEFILESMRELVDELGERDQAVAAQEPANPDADSTEAQSSQRCVLCLPARDEADEIAAQALAQVLQSNGYCAQHVSTQMLASEMVNQIETTNAGVVCVSAVPPFAQSHARYICKRVRARFPDVRLVIGLWQSHNGKKLEEKMRSACAERVVTRFAQLLEQQL